LPWLYGVMTNFTAGVHWSQLVDVYCHGVNHHDEGKLGTCDDCRAYVVKVSKPGKKPYLVPARVTERRTGFFCFSQVHECDEAVKALVLQERAERLASGSVEKGALVEVFKGRKVKVGTVGRIIWTGDSEWGPRVGIKTEAGETHFLAASNVKAVCNA
jgi:hypothetical protein